MFECRPGCDFSLEPGCDFSLEPGCGFSLEPGCDFSLEPGFQGSSNLDVFTEESQILPSPNDCFHPGLATWMFFEQMQFGLPLLGGTSVRKGRKVSKEVGWLSACLTDTTFSFWGGVP